VGQGLDDDPSPVAWHSFVFLTRDGGETWERIPVDGRGLEGAYVTSVCFTLEGFAVASGDGMTLLSRNSGESWTRSEGPSGRVACVGRRDLWLIGGATGPLYHSSDGGDSWIDMSTSLPREEEVNGSGPGSIGFLDATFGWIAGVPGALLITRDGGASWRHQTLFGSSVIFNLAAFLTPEQGLALTWGVGALTDDAGSTWRIVGIGRENLRYRFSDIDITP